MIKRTLETFIVLAYTVEIYLKLIDDKFKKKIVEIQRLKEDHWDIDTK